MPPACHRPEPSARPRADDRPPATAPGARRVGVAGALLAAWVAACIGVSPDARAQGIYSCKDASGRTLTSDRPIPECATRPMRELSVSGVTKREIPAPLTKEQLARKQVEEEEQARVAAEERREQQRDRALLAAYPSVGSLNTIRAKQIADLHQDAGNTRKRMIDAHKDLKVALVKFKTATVNLTEDKYTAADKAMSRRIDSLRQAILRDDERLKKIELDEVRLNQRFDEDEQRLRRILREPDLPPVQTIASTPTKR